MGYSTKQEVIIALANALSRGSPQSPGVLVPITEIGNQLSSTVPDTTLYQYIRWADAQIDSAVSSIYRVPLQRVNRGTFNLAVDVTVGDLYITMEDATLFIQDDVIILRDSLNLQELTIASIPTNYRLNLTVPVTNSYLAVDARVERIRYPDPIPLISSRLAAAAVYDKYFAAQVEGNQSDFGKFLRKQAWDDLDQICAGTIKLAITNSLNLIGRRYYNQALDDVISTKAEPSKKWFSKE